MGIKDIVFSMLAVMIITFALYPFYRKREVKTNELEVKYYDALKNNQENVVELGMEYYLNIGLDKEAAEKSIESDRAHTKV